MTDNTYPLPLPLLLLNISDLPGFPGFFPHQPAGFGGPRILLPNLVIIHLFLLGFLRPHHFPRPHFPNPRFLSLLTKRKHKYQGTTPHPFAIQQFFKEMYA